MKDNWERLNAPQPIAAELLRKIIRPAFPHDSVSSLERMGTGLSNSNYRFFLEGHKDPFLLRLYSGGKETAEKEVNIARMIGRTVPVADFIYSDTSCTGFDQPWAILEWKEGTLLSELVRAGNPGHIAAAAESVGGALAEIHAYTFPQSGFLGPDLSVEETLKLNSRQFLSFMKEFLGGRCGSLLGEDLRPELWSFCQSNSHILDEINETPVLVHSDFNGLNIIMDQDSPGLPVSAVLDWEFAFSGSRYADIGNMLRYEEEGSAFEKSFIRGYQEKGIILDNNWRLLSRLEDLVALCDLLNRSTPDMKNRVSDLKRLIKGTIQKFS